MAKGYYDIHCHILPHVDDGSRSTAMSKDMLRIAYANGIRHIILTPHYMIGRFEKGRDEIYDQYRLFLAKVQDEFPDIEFMLGREIFFGEDIAELLQENVVSTLNDTDYALNFTRQQRQTILRRVFIKLRMLVIPLFLLTSRDIRTCLRILR